MFNHFKQRATERLSKEFTDYDCETIIHMIQTNQAQVIKKPWFVVYYKGYIFKVCYKKGSLRTCLPVL